LFLTAAWVWNKRVRRFRKASTTTRRQMDNPHGEKRRSQIAKANLMVAVDGG
jgi:hypothetical protein